MKLKSFLLIILSIFQNSFGQIIPNKTEKFDLQIFEYLNDELDSKTIPLNTFLEYSKPFSKWDIRPINDAKIYAMDSIATSSEIPNFIWGAFSSYYDVKEKDALDKANIFLNNGVSQEEQWSTHLKSNVQDFEKLTKLILKTNNKIFVSQSGLQKVDETYFEDGKFWKYVIPKNSPFPISNKIEDISNFNFSKNQNEILKSMLKLKIYAVYKSKKGLFFLIDGFTDNSYGFYFNEDGSMEKENHLFEIMKYDQINNQYFYYIAN